MERVSRAFALRMIECNCSNSFLMALVDRLEKDKAKGQGDTKEENNVRLSLACSTSGSCRFRFV